MSIIQDMDACFVANRPLPPGAAWLVGGNVWHALMADLQRVYADQGMAEAFDPRGTPPRELYGAELRRVPRMTGWVLAERVDACEEPGHGKDHRGVDAHAKSLAE